jgi:hypothetical protein
VPNNFSFCCAAPAKKQSVQVDGDHGSMGH